MLKDYVSRKKMAARGRWSTGEGVSVLLNWCRINCLWLMESTTVQMLFFTHTNALINCNRHAQIEGIGIVLTAFSKQIQKCEIIYTNRLWTKLDWKFTCRKLLTINLPKQLKWRGSRLSNFTKYFTNNSSIEFTRVYRCIARSRDEVGNREVRVSKHIESKNGSIAGTKVPSN